MAIDANDLLIFKMRGLAWEQAKPRGRPGKPVYTRPERPAAGVPAPEATAISTQKEWLESPEDAEEQARIKEIENLEQMIQVYGAQIPLQMEGSEIVIRRAGNVFTRISGVLFLANATLFGYFIYPQAEVLASYFQQVGLESFLFNWNSAYSISLINLILIALSLLSGLLMVANTKKGQIIGTATGSMILMAISYEYLNSSANYLLAVSAIAFVSIVVLAYARMSAVSQSENETPITAKQQQIEWPRIESF